MQVSFNAQPSDDGRDLRDFLAAVAADEALTDLEVVVAWAKRSGLALVRADLETIRARDGGSTRLIVGIDEGGATQEGLQLAREIFDTVHVFHEDTWRTFHPKVYIAQGDTSARVLVGSNNLTAGGVYYNYEAALECVLDLSLPDDAALTAQLAAFVERLRADEAVCLPLDEDLYQELITNPRYRVRPETVEKREVPAEDPDDLPDNVDTPDAPTPAAGAPHPPSVFGPSTTPKRKRPATKKAAAKKVAAKKAAAAVPAPPAPPDPPAAGAIVVRRWFRRMDGTAAQHPPSADTNPTGNLRLTLGTPRLPIDKLTWFRHDLFGGEAWAPEVRGGEEVEVADVPMRVVEMGQDRGVHNIKVSHAPHREEDQNNIPSVLHWGTVAPLLAATNHTGRTVVLERFDNGTYQLTITDQVPTVDDFVG